MWWVRAHDNCYKNIVGEAHDNCYKNIVGEGAGRVLVTGGALPLVVPEGGRRAVA